VNYNENHPALLSCPALMPVPKRGVWAKAGQGNQSERRAIAMFSPD